MTKFSDFHRQNLIRMVKAQDDTFDPQVFDWKGHWDSSLKPNENYHQIAEKLKQRGIIDVTQYPEAIKDQVEIDEARATAREVKNDREVFEDSLKELKNKGVDLDSYFTELKQFVEILGVGDIDSLFLIGEAGIGKCVSFINENNSINCGGRMLREEDIPNSNGEEVYTLNTENQKIELSEIKNHYHRKAEELIKIKLRSGREIGVTPEHLLYTLSGWKQAKDLKEDWSIATARKIKTDYPKKLDDYKVRVLAYLIAEGGFRGQYPSFTNQNEELVENCKKNIEKFGRTVTLKKCNSRYGYAVWKEETWVDGSRKNPVKEWLKELNLWGKKSIDKEIPKKYLEMTNEQVKEFLGILYCCDGCIENNNISYYTGSRKLALQIQQLLFRLGIISFVKKHTEYKGRNYYRVIITEHKSIIKFGEEIPLISKQDKLDKLVERKMSVNRNPNIDYVPLRDLPEQLGICNKGDLRKGAIKNQDRKTINNEIIKNSEIFWDEIESIEKVEGEFDVYDLEIDHNSHNFLMDGIVVHNSYNTLKKLSEMEEDFSYWQGNITPFKLYQLLYEHNGEVIFFDDTQSLIQNKRAMSLLIQALWSATGERKVSWLSSKNSLKKQGIPEEFVFNGKIIFSLNEIPDSVEVRVLLSRCFKYELNFNYKEKLKMMYEIAKREGNGLTPEDRVKIVDFIAKHTSKATKDFNLRLQKKVEEIFKASDNWKSISRIFLVEDDMDRLVLDLVESGKPVDEQIKIFKEKTGGSRGTYFYRKKQLT